MICAGGLDLEKALGICACWHWWSLLFLGHIQLCLLSISYFSASPTYSFFFSALTLDLPNWASVTVLAERLWHPHHHGEAFCCTLWCFCGTLYQQMHILLVQTLDRIGLLKWPGIQIISKCKPHLNNAIWDEVESVHVHGHTFMGTDRGTFYSE